MKIIVSSLVPFKQNYYCKNNTVKINTNAESRNYGNTKLMSYPANYYLSFGKKEKTHEEIIKRIGEENFPSIEILENFRIQKDKSLYEVHTEYYKDLLDCKTLEEAKEKYPEFEDVIDAKDINIEKLPHQSALYKISQGKIDGTSLDTLSLELLKRYYGEVKTLKKPQNYWNISSQTFYKQIFPELNIKTLSINYGKSLVGYSPILRDQRCENMRNLYNGENSAIYKEISRQTLKRNKENLEFIEKQRQGVRTDEYRERARQITKSNWKNPEFIEKQRQGLQTDECREKQKLSYLSYSLAYFFNPNIRNTMSDVAVDFPELAQIIENEKNGIIIDEEQKEHLTYFKLVENTMPGYQSKFIAPVYDAIYSNLKNTIQNVKDDSATDDDLTELTGYYLLTKVREIMKRPSDPSYLDCFSDVEDKLLENKDTYNRAVSMLSDYYKKVQKQYPKEIVDKYFSGLKEVLEEEQKKEIK